MDPLNPKPGDTFPHRYYITGSPKAGTDQPEVCRVTRVTKDTVWYRVGGGPGPATTRSSRDSFPQKVHPMNSALHRADQHKENTMTNTAYFCLTCGVKNHDWGNNPDPIGMPADDAEAKLLGDDRRVCNDCNYMYVIPARLGRDVSGELYDAKGRMIGTFGTVKA